MTTHEVVNVRTNQINEPKKKNSATNLVEWAGLRGEGGEGGERGGRDDAPVQCHEVNLTVGG